MGWPLYLCGGTVGVPVAGAGGDFVYDNAGDLPVGGSRMGYPSDSVYDTGDEPG